MSDPKPVQFGPNGEAIVPAYQSRTRERVLRAVVEVKTLMTAAACA